MKKHFAKFTLKIFNCFLIIFTVTNQKNNHYLAYNVGFNLNFYKGYGLYFAYIRDYTSPTFNDLYYGTFSNPYLLPETYDQLTTKLTLEPINNLKIEASYAYSVYRSSKEYSLCAAIEREYRDFAVFLFWCDPECIVRVGYQND